MSSHFRLRRRDLRWLLFPAMALAAGLLAMVIIVFSPGHVLAAYEFSRAQVDPANGSMALAIEAAPQAQ